MTASKAGTHLYAWPGNLLKTPGPLSKKGSFITIAAAAHSRIVFGTLRAPRETLRTLRGSSEDVCPGTEVLSLFPGQTYVLTNALTMNTHMERRQLPPFGHQGAGNELLPHNFTLQPHHLSTVPSRKPGLEFSCSVVHLNSRVQLFSECDP